jgi:enoyl-CoA hydratase
VAEFKHLTLEFPEPNVGLVTMNRPEVLNAANTVMAGELRDVFSLAGTGELSEISCLVLTGAGERAFSAGGDLKERNGMSNEQWQSQRVVFREYNRAQEACPIPIVCAVNGLAMGGGLEMIMRSDFAYAVEDAKFALPEIRHGFFPGSGGTQRFSRLTSEARAKEVILSGESFSAQEAAEWGVVNKLFAREELLPAVISIAAKIAAHPTEVVRTVKHVIHDGLQMDIKSGLQLEVENHDRISSSESRLKGIAEFNERSRSKTKDA